MTKLMTQLKSPLKVEKSSICFAVPFRLDDISIIKRYFKEAAGSKYKDAKRAFIKEFAKKCNMCVGESILCTHNGDFDSYKNYACRCLRLSNKFHDDYRVDDKVLQVSLGSVEIEYIAPIWTASEFHDKYPKVRSINPTGKLKRHFNVKIILHITCDERLEKSGRGDREKNNYTDDVKYSMQLLFIVEDAGKSVEDLIFTKHLFYKNSLKCIIQGQPQSISCWAKRFRDRIIKSFKIKDTIIPEHFCFDSSFEEVSVKGDMKTLYNNHYAEICGMLTANEEYPFVTKHYAKKTLKTQWSCYESSQYYFLSNNILNIRNNYIDKSSNKHICKWFIKYSRNDKINKYIDRTLAENCIVGLKDIILFDYLDFNKKRFILQEAIDRTAKLFLNDRSDISFEDIQRNQNIMNSIIATYPHGAIGRGSLNQCLEEAFNINGLSEVLKEYYTRSSSLMESKYNKRINDLVVKISKIGVCIAIAIFVLGLILDSGNNLSCQCKVLSVSILVTMLVIMYVIRSNIIGLCKKVGGSRERGMMVFLLTVISCLIALCIYLLRRDIEPINILNIWSIR